MAVYTRIIMGGEDFLYYIKELSNAYGISCYIEYRNESKKALYKKINLEDDFSDVFNSQYSCFFLCAKQMTDSSSIDFYNHELLSDTIEGEGGRETLTEVERIDLRMLSKNPHDNIRLFANALNNKLKKDLKIGKGVKIGDYFNKDIYYFKGVKKIIWESFDRKKFLIPIKID